MDNPPTVAQALRDGYLICVEFTAGEFEAQLFFPGCCICRARASAPLLAQINLETEMARLGWPQIERRRHVLTQMREPELRPAENGSARGRGQGWLGILLQPLRNAFRR